MLKRLFISLIILSALTSDASVFSAYLLSAGLNPEYWLNQLDDSRILAETAGSMHIVPADDIIQSRAMQGRLVFVLPDTVCDSSSEYGSNVVSYKPLPAENRDMTFGSDLSPPFA